MKDNSFQNNMNYETKPNVGMQPKKRKKKRVGLLVFLVILILIAAGIGIRAWRNDVATDYLDRILPDQPFVFSEDDYESYVTNNIKIPNEVEDQNKKINIEWISDKENIIAVNGTVNRPETQSEKVVLTASCRKGLGIGKKDYELTVIKSKTVDKKDIYVLSKEEIEKGIGKNNIAVTYDQSGNIETIDGNLDLTKIETKEDVLLFLKVYEDVLNIKNLSFEVDNISTIMNNRKFICIQKQNNIPVLGKNIIIKTSEEGYVNSINVNVERDVKNIKTSTLSENQILNIVKKRIGDDAFILSNKKVFYVNNDQKFMAYDTSAISEKNNKIEHFIINAETKKVVFQNTLASNISVSAESQGKDVYGNNQKFYVNLESQSGDEMYYFEDSKRNVRIMSGRSNLLFNIKKWNATTEHPYSYIMEEKNHEISSSKNDFSEYPSGISAYKNLVDVYDWYRNLGRKSFDGKGMPIGCVIDYSGNRDNAAYYNDPLHIFVVGDTEKFKYPLSGKLDVIAHEYTHGVVYFEVGGFVQPTLEFDAINEAYADIFGCLIEGNWEMGENVVQDGVILRDPTFQSNLKVYNSDKVPYPTEYKGKNWSNNDCHINSVVLSHVAYRMYQSGFTSEDIAKIWYNSFSYGLRENSTFIDVRYNIERSAKDLNYSTKQVELIGKLFDEVKIKEKEKIIIKNYSVEGDMMKDDTTEKGFLVVWSPIGTLFGSPITVLEEDNSVETRYEDEDVSALLSEYLTTEINKEDDNENELNFSIDVDYSRLPKWAMKIVKNFADEAKQGIWDKVSAETGQTEDESGLFNLFFVVEYYEGTSYDFWTECFGIDLSKISFEK